MNGPQQNESICDIKSVISYEAYLCQIKYTWTSRFVIFVRWNGHEFPPVEGIENRDKSVLINIDSLTGNANIKRLLNVALPGDKLSKNFSELIYSSITKYLLEVFFSEVKIN